MQRRFRAGLPRAAFLCSGRKFFASTAASPSIGHALCFGGIQPEIECANAGNYDFLAEWRIRASSATAGGFDFDVSSSSTTSADVAVLDSDAVGRSLANQIDELSEAGRTKQIAKAAEISSRIQSILLFAPGEVLVEHLTPASVRQLLHAVSYLPHVPTSFAFQRCLIRALAIVTMSCDATDAAWILHAIQFRPDFFHHDIFTTLALLVTSDLASVTDHAVMAFAMSLTMVEDLLPAESFALVLDRVASIADSCVERAGQQQSEEGRAAAITVSTHAAEGAVVRFDVGALTQRLAQLQSAYSAALPAALLRYAVRFASEFNATTLIRLLHFAALPHVAPLAEGAVAAITERLLRSVQDSARNGFVSLPEVFDVLAHTSGEQLLDDAFRIKVADALAAVITQTLSVSVPSELESALLLPPPRQEEEEELRQSVPPGTASTAEGEERPASRHSDAAGWSVLPGCPSCGGRVVGGWTGVNVAANFHKCYVNGIGPMTMREHTRVLSTLMNHGRHPATCGLTAVLAYWLVSRLSVRTFDVVLSTSERDQVRAVIRRLRDMRFVLANGSVQLPLPESSAGSSFVLSPANSREKSADVDRVLLELESFVGWQYRVIQLRAAALPPRKDGHGNQKNEPGSTADTASEFENQPRLLPGRSGNVVVLKSFHELHSWRLDPARGSARKKAGGPTRHEQQQAQQQQQRGGHHGPSRWRSAAGGNPGTAAGVGAS